MTNQIKTAIRHPRGLSDDQVLDLYELIQDISRAEIRRAETVLVDAVNKALAQVSASRMVISHSKAPDKVQKVEHDDQGRIVRIVTTTDGDT